MSSRRIARFMALILLVAWIGSACKSTGEIEVPDFGSFGGVTYRMVEQAHDGNHTVPPTNTIVGAPSSRATVDANSTLIVSFETSDVGTRAEPASERWKQLNELLETTKDMAREYERLNAIDIDINDEAAVAKLRTALRDYDRKLLALLTKNLPALIPEGGSFKMKDVLDGTWDGSPESDDPAFANLGRWIEKQLEIEQEQTESIIENADRYQVSVQAFLNPKNGKTSQLHVSKYDTIAQGEYAPIDRYAVRLTDAERAELKMRLEQAELAADAIREVTDKKKRRELQKTIDKLVGNIRNRFDKIAKTLRDGPTAWETELSAAESGLRDFAAAADTPTAAATSATTAADQLASFNATLKKIIEVTEKIDRLDKPVAGSGALFDTLLFGDDSIVSTIEDITVDVTEWPGKLEALLESTEELASVSGSPIVPDELTAFLTRVEKQFPDTFKFIDLAWAKLRVSRSQETGAAALADAKDKLRYHPLESAPDAEIELPRAGLFLGDDVDVRVAFYEDDDEEEPKPGNEVEEVSFRTTTTLTGLHRKIGAKLIFARAYSSEEEDAETWQPNVAAMADWHYYFRDPEGDFETTWNVIDPAIGLHAASLDQADDSVEVGLGLNLSVFEGFLSGGVGWNLSADRDQLYYFVGLDLVELLQAGQGLVSR